MMDWLAFAILLLALVAVAWVIAVLFLRGATAAREDADEVAARHIRETLHGIEHRYAERVALSQATRFGDVEAAMNKKNQSP